MEVINELDFQRVISAALKVYHKSQTIIVTEFKTNPQSFRIKVSVISGFMLFKKLQFATYSL